MGASALFFSGTTYGKCLEGQLEAMRCVSIHGMYRELMNKYSLQLVQLNSACPERRMAQVLKVTFPMALGSFTRGGLLIACEKRKYL